MATSAKESVVLSTGQELLFKLIGPQQHLLGSHSILAEYKERLRRHLGYLENTGTVYEVLLAFDDRYGRLPESWDQLYDYAQGTEKNDAPVTAIQELRLINPDDITYKYSDLQMCLEDLIEELESARVQKIAKVAARIASGGMTIKEQKYKGSKDAVRWLLQTISTPESTPVELEAGERELFSGYAAGQSFKIVGINVDEVESKPISWLWDGRIPLGGLTLIGGKPGRGKSQAAIDLIARVTTGANFADGVPNTMGPRNVVLVAAEDDLDKIIRPRLQAAGADLKRVTYLTKVIAQDHTEENSSPQQRSLMLSHDVAALKQFLDSQPDVALVVIDTITSFYGDVNPNVDKDIRPILDELKKVFGQAQATLLALIHYNKRSDADAVSRFLGGSSVVGSARSAWDFSQDTEDKDLYRMTCVKNNWGKLKSGIEYRFAEKEVEPGIHAPYIAWEETTDMSADDVITKERDRSSEKKESAKVVAAKLFLKVTLEKGDRLARELFPEADKEGISEWNLRKAQKELAVSVYQKGGGFWWSLPAKEDDKPIENVEAL